MEYYHIFTIAWLTVLFATMTEQGLLLDKLVRRVSHANSGSCTLCSRMMQERCNTGEKINGKTLCQRIAAGTCPTRLFYPKFFGDVAEGETVANGRKSDSDSIEVLLVQQRPKNPQEEKHILHLMSGILTAAHSSAKADLRRAKIKEAKAKLSKTS